MPSLPYAPAPNTVAVEATYSTPGGFAQNIYHVQGDAPYTDIAAMSNRLIAAFETWEAAHGATFRCLTTKLVDLKVRDIGQRSGPVVEKAENIQGSASGTQAPDSVSFAVKWTTARAGRSFRGRTFCIGLGVGSFASDQVVAGGAANIAAAYKFLIAAFNNAGWLAPADTHGKMVLVRRQFNKIALNPAQCEPILDCVAANSYIATRRTRLTGRHLKR